MFADKHLRRALAVATTSTCRTRHGAVVALRGRVLAVGVNTSRNRPEACTDPRTQAARHAEWNALRQLPTGTDYSRLALYSARVRKDGTPALAKPCPLCQDLLDLIGLREVYWT